MESIGSKCPDGFHIYRIHNYYMIHNHYMKRLLYVLPIFALYYQGCTSEVESEISGDSPIEFSTYISQTRAESKTIFENGDQIGLYACKTIGDYTNSFSANFMNNVSVSYNDGKWSYSPIMAWPSDENEHLSFIAYYPRSTSQPNVYSYPITVSTDVDNQVDYLYCTIKDTSVSNRTGTELNGEHVSDFTATEGPINLQFKHMLANVKISIKLDGDYPGVTALLKSLSLSNVYNTGEMNLYSDFNTLTCISLSNLGNYYLLKSNETSKQIKSTPIEWALFLLPQNTIKSETYLSFTYTHDYTDGEGSKTITKKIYLRNNWESNKCYNYIINLSLDSSAITLYTDIEDMDGTEDVGEKDVK